MRIHVLILVIAAALALISLASGAERGGTTLVTPPWTHCLGLHKVTQFHLDIYSGYREKFIDPEGLFCVKLVGKDKPDTPRDDDELTVYGLNSGACTVPNTACGSCSNGACKPIRPTGELICAYQTQTGCSPEACTSTADCADGRFCVGATGDAHCCDVCF